jgi:hypothetical protein
MAACILSQLFFTPVGNTKSVTRGTARCDLHHTGPLLRYVENDVMFLTWERNQSHCGSPGC